MVFLSNKTWKKLLTFVRHVFNLSNQVFNIQFLKTFKNLSKFLFILLQTNCFLSNRFPCFWTFREKLLKLLPFFSLDYSSKKCLTLAFFKKKLYKKWARYVLDMRSTWAMKLELSASIAPQSFRNEKFANAAINGHVLHLPAYVLI